MSAPTDDPAHVAPSPPPARAKERFLDRPMLVALALYGLFAFTFSLFQVQGDALVYYNLLRKFFGEEPDFAYAYQFGSALWNAPFFLVGKAFAAVFGFQPDIFHVAFEEIALTVAANVAFLVTLYLGWLILRELDLPRGPAVLFLAVFGTPLFFYVVFDPSEKHVVDTLVLTAATYAFLRCERYGEPRSAIALGALCGWSLNIRWANVAFFAALAVALLVRRRPRLVRDASVAAVAATLLIFALPALRGIEYFLPIIDQPSNAGYALAAPAGKVVFAEAATNTDSAVDPTIPVRMLFSLHRGLFLWTPLTALAAAGFGLALARARRSTDFPFLAALLAGSLALLCIHVLWRKWDGGFSFSQRFLTGLFPLYLIGVAELVRRSRALAYPILVAAAAFALMVAFVHDVGYDGISERDGLDRILDVVRTDHHNLRIEVQEDAKKRWRYAWGLLHGRDSECLHEPLGTTDC